MTLIPQVNATLTLISGAGFSEDYDVPAGTSTTKWMGLSGVYVHEDLKSMFNPQGGISRVSQTTLYIDADLANGAGMALGDAVSYQFRGKTFTARIQDIAGYTLPGTPHYVKAALEEINAT